MEAAVVEDTCDLIGLARPAVLNPALPRRVILNSNIPDREAVAFAKKIKAGSFTKYIGVKAIGVGAGSGGPWLEKLFYTSSRLLPCGCGPTALSGRLGNRQETSYARDSTPTRWALTQLAYT